MRRIAEHIRAIPNSRRLGRSLILAWVAGWTGCAILEERGDSLIPTRHQLRMGPFLIHSHSPVSPEEPAIRGLHDLLSDLEAALGQTPDHGKPPIEIYILRDRSDLARFRLFHYPELPARRAFFLAQGERRVVYTYHSPRLLEDLRHESTHALLRELYGEVPLWLDEGLAEFFEGSRGGTRVEEDHLPRLLADLQQGWQPDLQRLESLTEIHQLTPRDYREAWAWVHLLLTEPRVGRPLLLGYLQTCRDRSAPPGLEHHLTRRGLTSSSLVNHLRTIEAGRILVMPAAPQKPTVIRAQDPSVEPVRAPDSSSSLWKRGLLRRIRIVLGL